MVVAVAALDRVGLGLTIQNVVARAAVDGVRAGIAVDDVLVGYLRKACRPVTVAGDGVVAVAATDDVGPRRTGDGVVATETDDDVVSPGSLDEVVAVGAGDRRGQTGARVDFFPIFVCPIAGCGDDGLDEEAAGVVCVGGDGAVRVVVFDHTTGFVVHDVSGSSVVVDDRVDLDVRVVRERPRPVRVRNRRDLATAAVGVGVGAFVLHCFEELARLVVGVRVVLRTAECCDAAGLVIGQLGHPTVVLMLHHLAVDELELAGLAVRQLRQQQTTVVVEGVVDVAGVRIRQPDQAARCVVVVSDRRAIRVDEPGASTSNVVGVAERPVRSRHFDRTAIDVVVVGGGAGRVDHLGAATQIVVVVRDRRAVTELAIQQLARDVVVVIGRAA